LQESFELTHICERCTLRALTALRQPWRAITALPLDYGVVVVIAVAVSMVVVRRVVV
jgi:hypothetical protein